MNQEQSLSVHPESTESTPHFSLTQRVFRRLIFDAIAPMTRGSLHVTLPDGTTRLVGEAGREIDASIRVVSERVFERLVLYGDIGFGEGYVEGDWETADLSTLLSWCLLNVEGSPLLTGARAKKRLVNFFDVLNRFRHRLRPNSERVARGNIAKHYDLGNDFYRLWLDPSMTYSGALFTSADQSLEEAQIAKYESLCRRLALRVTDQVLEIGCGWGGFSAYAARRYGCRITAVTISAAQHRYAQERIAHEGLANRVEVRLQDYRRVAGRYDKIVSIEMMEALGDSYLEIFCAKIHALLAPQGLFAAQFITVPDARHAALRRGVDWIQKHIFPGSLLLSIARVEQAMNRTGDLFLAGLDDLGLSYARTLRMWHEAFNQRAAEVLALGFDERFLRKWNYYLVYCESAFAMRNISVVHAVFTRPNNHTLPDSIVLPP